MAERNLGDLVDITEANLFTEGTSVLLNVSGRFRDLASTLVRNAISKALIRSEDRDPATDDRVPGLTQIWYNADDGTQHLSKNGGAWSQVANNTEDGDDGWSPVFSVIENNARRVLQLTDWIEGEGTKPATGKYVGSSGLVTAIADAVDIRGAPGTPGAADDGDDGWSPEFAIASDSSRRVVKLVDWHGGEGTKPAINKYVGSTGFVTAIADAVDIRGPAGTSPQGGLTSVTTNDTLEGDGTAGSALGVASDLITGEIGRILALGEYTFGTSTTPASGNAGWGTSNTLYVHTTDTDSNDLSATLGKLKQGDYLHIGTAAILEITAAPTVASSVYSFSVRVLDGAVPTTASHMLYSIKESRALMEGAVHKFHFANGAGNKILGFANNGSPEYKDWVLWKTHARAPANGDKVTGATVVFYDSSRKETHVSIVGSDWILLTSANAVMKATSIGDFNISADTSTSPLGDIVISSNYVAFSTTDRAGSAVGSLLNDIDIGNVIIVYVGGVWKNTLRVASIDTTNDIYMGTWEKTYAASDFPAGGIATADHIAPDKLIESGSVGSRELKDKGVIASKFGKNAVETGKTVLLGEWDEGSIGLNRGNFQTHQASSSRQIEIEKVDSADNSFDPNEAEIEDLEAGDLIYLLADSGSTGINALLVSEPPSSETDSYRIKGEWQEHYQAISAGTSVSIYKVKSNNILAKGVPSTSKFIGAEADGEPVWKTSGQQGEGATADDIQSGVYSELVTRTIIDSGSPVRGQMTMTSTALQIHYEAGDATVNSDALEAIAVGDRLQISDVNVFVVSHVPPGSPVVFTFSGTWAETFDADAFETSVTLYHIKKMNVLIHNVAVPGRSVKIGPSRLLEAEALDERHAETLWAAPNGGVITSSSTTTYTLGAGKKFSDFRDIYVIHDARASNFPPTANQKMSAMVFPSNQFKSGYMPRIQIDGNWKDIFIVSDTQFRIQAASSETVMHIRSLLGAK